MVAPPGIPARVRAHHLFPTQDDLRRLWALALPVVVVQLGMMLMGVVTTIMVGRVSATELAAAALGNLCFIWLVMLGWGTLMSLDPIVAQAHGADDREGVARGVQRGLVLAAGLGALTAILFLPVRPALVLLRQPADVVPLAARYIEVSIPGILPFFVFLVLRQSLQAMGRMRAIVITILGANVFNAALGWALIFGHLGSPALGAVGAGLAATVSRFVLVLGLLVLAWSDLRPLLSPPRREALDRLALVRIVQLGVPIGLQMQLEYGVFAFVALLMGRLGTVPMAAHQIALTVASVTFMVPQGIGGAAAVLVGQAIGADDGSRARRAAAASLGAGAGFMLLCGLALMALPGPLARLFSFETPVLAVATLLLPIAGVFQVFDGIQVVSIGILRGLGDTRAPVLLNVLAFWLIGLPASLWFGFGLHGGPAGLWWGLVVGLVLVAVALLARVRQRLRRSLARLVVDGTRASV
jgi:multidrug resistance protein, MATE family